MGSLLTPGALAEGVLAVGDRMDDGIFSRRDRVHFTIASSLYSDNPSAPPLTLDFDVTANFGPFGLTGDIFVLNATTGSAKLLKMLEGTHPRLSIRWSRSVFDAALKIAASAAPFDMRLNFVKPGVGPISWRLAAPKPVECSLKLPKQGSLSTVCTAPALLVSLTDPAANISEVRLTRASLTASPSKLTQRWRCRQLARRMRLFLPMRPMTANPQSERSGMWKKRNLKPTNWISLRVTGAGSLRS